MNGVAGNLYPPTVKPADAQANEAALAELAASRGQSKGELLAEAWKGDAEAMAAHRAAGRTGPADESFAECCARKGVPMPVYPRKGVPSYAVAAKELRARIAARESGAPVAAVKLAPPPRKPRTRPVPAPMPAPPDEVAAKLAAALDRIELLERENADLRAAIEAHFRRRLEVVA